MDYYIKELGFNRNRIGERLDNLNDWFLERCRVPSGSKYRKYATGTEESMYLEYVGWCTEQGLSFQPYFFNI